MKTTYNTEFEIEASDEFFSFIFCCQCPGEKSLQPKSVFLSFILVPGSKNREEIYNENKN